MALESSLFEPMLLFRYVDDTFNEWPHGKELFYEVKEYLNNKYDSIRFIMEIKSNNSITFLDVLDNRQSSG